MTPPDPPPETGPRASPARRVVFTAVLTLGVVVAAVLLFRGATTPDITPAQAPRWVSTQLRGVAQDGIVLGDPKAPLTLVEFADLTCAGCRAFDLDVLPTLIKRYVWRGILKVDFRALHGVGDDQRPGGSLAAAQMALAAGAQNHLWSFVELFSASQRDDSAPAVTDASLRRVASGIPGFNVATALADCHSAPIRRDLAASRRLFEASGLHGAPSFLVGLSSGRLRPLSYRRMAVAPFTSAIQRVIRG